MKSGLTIIGITGGIGSGKTTVSTYLRDKGFKVVDADEIARGLLKKGEACYFKVLEHFGEKILEKGGNINRKELGKIVFSSKKEKSFLNNLTHREVEKNILNEIEKSRNNSENLLFLDIPLLFEIGMNRICDTTWLVTAPIKLRIRRVLKRDNISEEEIKKRMENQMSDEDKMKLSDHVIDNSENEEALYLKIDKLLKEYEKEKRL